METPGSRSTHESWPIGRIAPERASAPRVRLDTACFCRGSPKRSACLAEVREVLLDASVRGIDVPPAGAWLLDAYFLVVEHGREIRANMPQGYYQQLPKLDSGPYRGFPRIYGIALELIAHTEGQLDRAEHRAHDTRVSDRRAVDARRALGVARDAPHRVAREACGAWRSARRVTSRTRERADEQVQRFRSVPGGDDELAEELCGVRRASARDDGGVSHAILPADSRRARRLHAAALGGAVDRGRRDERRGGGAAVHAPAVAHAARDGEQHHEPPHGGELRVAGFRRGR